MPAKNATGWKSAWNTLQELDEAWPSGEFVSSSEINAWIEQYGVLTGKSSFSDLAKSVPMQRRDAYIERIRRFSDPRTAFRTQNVEFVENRLVEDAEWFESLEAWPLTDRQRRAVVINEAANLVVAGAGTGKTSTIIARVEYLVRRKLAAPHEILVLAFGTDAAAELNQRIAGLEYASSVRASTFHSLGFRILGDVEGHRPPLTALSSKTGSLQMFVYQTLQQLVTHKEYWRLFDALARLTGTNENLIEPVRSSRTGRGEMHTQLVKDLAESVSLYKGQDRDMLSLLRSATKPEAKVFLNILELVMERYQEELASSGQIDFNDMINRARAHVRSGKWRSPYRHIIIDEFQDIANSTWDLVQALRQQVSHARLFAVGDDWQAIYGFNGGDVSIMTGMEQREPALARTDLDVAFRYQQELLDISSQFVMKNPRQLRKKLKAQQGKGKTKPICIIFAEEERKDDAWNKVLQRIARQTQGELATVFALGRYTFNVPRSAAAITRDFTAHNLQLKFMTAHRAKGLEADYVVIPEISAGEYGFPSNLEDHPVISMLRTSQETFPNAEERRLFYVALTRARQRVFLIAPADNASPFVSEDLMKPELRKFVTVIGKPVERPTCPDCHQKTIRKRTGRNGTFWACSRYPTCRGALPNCPECQTGGLYQKQNGGRFHCTSCDRTFPICKDCHRGAVYVGEGKYGVFEKCTNYRNH